MGLESLGSLMRNAAEVARQFNDVQRAEQQDVPAPSQGTPETLDQATQDLFESVVDVFSPASDEYEGQSNLVPNSQQLVTTEPQGTENSDSQPTGSGKQTNETVNGEAEGE